MSSKISNPKLILNLGCGSNPLCDTPSIKYVNVDMTVAPGVLIHDITKVPYPFEKESFDMTYMFHCIEHIPKPDQFNVLSELWRVLKPSGRACFSYPEFKKCAMNYINNKNCEREFWEATIYGRGLTEWDRHKALMDTEEFTERLKMVGFKVLKHYPEKNQDFNTVVICEKAMPFLSYEALMEAECGGNS